MLFCICTFFLLHSLDHLSLIFLLLQQVAWDCADKVYFIWGITPKTRKFNNIDDNNRAENALDEALDNT